MRAPVACFGATTVSVTADHAEPGAGLAFARLAPTAGGFDNFAVNATGEHALDGHSDMGNGDGIDKDSELVVEYNRGS